MEYGTTIDRSAVGIVTGRPTPRAQLRVFAAITTRRVYSTRVLSKEAEESGDIHVNHPT